MKKFFPLLILAAVVVVFFRQFFLNNLLPIPSDTIVGLYNPFRDLYASSYPRGIPFKNFLVTDPVRQQYPWKLEVIKQEKQWQIPLWNPYNFAGTPLLANLQSAAFMPLNALFFILPFSTAWSLLIMLQPLIAGIFMFLYLRNLKHHVFSSLLGSIVFIFSGFFIAWLEWGSIDTVVMMLPLGFLCIDKAFASKRKIGWYILCLLTFVFAFFAGHAQTFFYITLLTVAYFLTVLLSSEDKKVHVLSGIIISILFVLLTSIQLIPFIQFILHSARETDLVKSAGWFLPYQHLVTFFVPDFFGNPATLNYWGVWNYAELAGYIGIVGLFFALYALCFKQEKRFWVFAVAGLIAFLFALPTYFANIPFMFHVPFLATAQPTRLMIIIDFTLSILAAFGMNNFLQSRKRIHIPIALFFVVFIALWTLVLFHARLLPFVSLENITVARHNLFFPSGILVALVVLILLSIFIKKKYVVLGVAVCLLILAGVDGFRFADKFTPFTYAKYLFPATTTTQFLQKNIGNYRFMTTDSQILPPNFSLVYHLQSVDGYDPLYIREYGELIASMERGKPDLQEPFGFNRIITPHNYQSPLVNLLGVKYILSLSQLRSDSLKEVSTEGQTRVYENKDVFPRAFFVTKVSSALSDQVADNFLFDQKENLRKSAVVIGDIDTNTLLSDGLVIITSYEDNKVTLTTENKGTGFLLLTDVFYPTWHAYVDGKETKIYRTDLALRGIYVEKGSHTVTFSTTLY